MPTQWAHALYWNFSDSNAAPVITPGEGGYPLWQSSVIAPSLLGMLGAWLDTRLAQIRWLWRLLRRVRALDVERRGVLLAALAMLEDPAYGTARVCVRETATTLGFNRPEAWKEWSREIKADPGRAENAFRHLRSMSRLRTVHTSTLSNAQQNLVTELAYHGFAIMGK